MGRLIPGGGGELALDLCGARRGLTFVTVPWGFPVEIITDHARVLTVAAVVPPDVLLDAVGQGPLGPRAPHVVQVDGASSLPEVGQASGFGRAPAGTAF